MEINLSVPPPTPRNLTTVRIERTEIELKWSPPESHDVYALLYYIVEFKKFGGKWKEKNTNNEQIETFTLTNLETGTSYSLRVSAKNNYGLSVPSATLRKKTMAGTNPPQTLQVVFVHGETHSLRIQPSPVGRLRFQTHERVSLGRWREHVQIQTILARVALSGKRRPHLANRIPEVIEPLLGEPDFAERCGVINRRLPRCRGGADHGTAARPPAGQRGGLRPTRRETVVSAGLETYWTIFYKLYPAFIHFFIHLFLIYECALIRWLRRLFNTLLAAFLVR